MKYGFLSLLFSLTFAVLSAQEYDYVLPDSLPDKSSRSNFSLPIKSKQQPVYIVPSYAEKEVDAPNTDYWEDEDGEKPEGKKQGNTSVNLEVGASATSFGGGNSAFTTYASPNVRHEVNDRVAVTAGVMMSQTYFDGWKNYSFEGGPMPSVVYNNMVYGRVDYRISEDLLVYGGVYQNITTMPVPGGNRNLSGTGFMAGMEYKMSERSFLRVEVRTSQGYNPYNPYNNFNSLNPYTNFGFGGRPISYFP